MPLVTQRPPQPSLTDLKVEANVVQARFELNRAVDTQDDAALLAWAKRWADDAIAACEK